MGEPDPEPLADGPPHWAFYSLWPRTVESDASASEPAERHDAEPVGERREAAMS